MDYSDIGHLVSTVSTTVQVGNASLRIQLYIVI